MGGWVGGCVCGRVGGWVGDRWYGWVVWVAGLLCQVARSPAGTAASLRPRSDPACTRTPCSCLAAAAPLALINEYKTQADNFAEWQKWGEEILVGGVGGSGQVRPACLPLGGGEA